MLIEELVERTIYHTIRREIVDRGYLPDIDSYDVENSDFNIAKTESIRYNKDISDIAKDKGFAIEVFNYANNQAYGEKKPPRIVLLTDSFLPGELGTDPSGYYEKQIDGTHIRKKSVDVIADYYFSLHLVANTTQQIRQLHDIMVNVIPRRGYLQRYTDTELRPYSNIMVEYLNNTDVSFLAEGLIEKVYRYKICDLHEFDDKVVEINIPPIKQIKVDITGDLNDNLIIQ